MKKTLNPVEIASTESSTLLEQAGRDANFLLRWAAALNPNTPDKFIRHVSKDESYYVTGAVLKRLASP